MTSTIRVIATETLDRLDDELIDPADDGYDIIVALLQSNASGVKAIPVDSRLDASDPRIYQWGLYTLPGQVQLATVPVQMPDATLGLGVAPALSFARWYAAITPSNRRVLIVGAAYSGTGFIDEPDTYSWHENITGEFSLRENAVAQTLAALAEAGDNARIAAFYAVGGEEDAEHLMDGAAHQEHLDGLIDYLRDELDADTVPFVIGQMVPDYLSTDTREEIDAVQIETPRRKPYTGFAYGPSGYTMGDAKHYNPAGARLLGRSLLEGWRLAQANVADSTPEAPTGLILSQVGSDVLVTWKRPLCRVTDFSVSYNLNGGAFATLARDQSIDNHATVPVTKGDTVQVRVATVNENGTSNWSTTATIVTVTDPAQVTGLVAGTPLASAVPLDWNDAARAEVYVPEAKLSAGSIWTPYTPVEVSSGRVQGLTPGSAYDLSVISRNDAGDSPRSAIVTATTTAVNPFLADVPATAWFAWGMRKLRSDYSGECLQARRGIDDVLVDIGFDSGGNADETELLDAAEGGSLFLAQWYDQSSLHNCNLVQATAELQPRLVLDGVLDRVNGRPAPYFDGVRNYLLALAADGWVQIWGSAQAQSYLAVVEGDNANNNTIWAETGLTSTVNYQAHYANARKLTSQYRLSSILLVGGTAGTETAIDGTARVVSYVDTGGTTNAVNSWVDRAAHEVNRSPSAHTAMTLGQIGVGAFVRSSGVTNHLQGHLSELVIFRSALSTSDRQAGEINMRDWHATA